MFLIFISCPGYGQENSFEGKDSLRILDELVITAGRTNTFRPLAKVISAIDKVEIEKISVQNLADLLRYLQGVDLRSRGQEGVQADVNISGGTFDQTIILINGINFTDPQTGHHSLNIPVDITQIERIEVLQGPAAWAGGSAAFAGAVNIVTKSPSSDELSLSLSAGDFKYLRGSANLSFSSSSGKLSGVAGGGYTRSGGYSQNRDFKTGSFYTNVSYRPARGHTISFSGGYQAKDFGAYSFYTPAYPFQYEQTRLFLSSLEYLLRKQRLEVRIALSTRIHYDRFELFRYESPEWYTGHNYHRNNVTGVNLEAAYSWGGNAGVTIAGSELRMESISSTVLGRSLEKEKRALFEKNIFYTRGLSRYIPGIYLKHNLIVDKWRFSAGILSSNTYTAPAAGEEEFLSYGNGIYAGFTATYKITGHWEVNWWINNSFRNPTFTDLFYKSPTQSGNTGLKPEKAISSQAGISYGSNYFNGSFSLFYRHGYRIIDWTRESNSDQWVAGNLTNVDSRGAEVTLKYSPVKSLFKTLGISYTFLDVTKDNYTGHSLYATDFLRHKASLWIEHGLPWRLSARWDVSFRKREGTYLNVNNSEIPYRGFVLADVKIVRPYKSATFYLEATNLFNTDYLLIGNLEQPGRWFKAGVDLVIRQK
ncbi:MAG: TonB-dependent receptor [Bacteroidales bacterium]|nr:TonB-dependent receptor [Bacteroidales bacterium]